MDLTIGMALLGLDFLQVTGGWYLQVIGGWLVDFDQVPGSDQPHGRG